MCENLQRMGALINVNTKVYQDKPRVANLGIALFFRSLEAQDCECCQIRWIPPFEQTEEIEELLGEFL